MEASTPTRSTAGAPLALPRPAQLVEPPAAAIVGTGARSRATPARKTLHILLGLLSWVGFAALWIWQLDVSIPSDWGVAVAGLLVLFAVYGVYVIGWVAWNRSIYRRRHRRTEALEMEVAFEEDALGRAIEADPRLVLHSGEVAVSLSEDEQVKHYRAVR